jgi:hypothetical protein
VDIPLDPDCPDESEDAAVPAPKVAESEGVAVGVDVGVFVKMVRF